MRSSRLFAASRRTLLGAGVLCFAASAASLAVAGPTARLGAPYEAGGVWFVPAADPSYDEEGTAAEYGAGMEGRKTLSGDRFDPRAMAAAHATLPVPGVVEVTNLDTGKRLTLRINDRGPYAPGRILSLTPAAARALGMAPGENAHVRVRYPNAPPRRQAEARPAFAAPTPMTTAAIGAFGVQVGAFSDRLRAEGVARQVSAAGPVRVTSLERGGATLYRVTVGPVADARAAETARGRVEDLGFEGAKVIPAL